jgi:HAD superfamily hydrolase (TIGR01490 family)
MTEKRQAAFFDLDKTIIAKSSMLAYSKTFRSHGLLNRRTLAKAAYAQVIFQVLGADESKMEKMRQVALDITKGWNHDHVQDLVSESLHDVVVPIIYDDAVELIEKHKSEGRLVVIVSSAPAEVVAPMAEHLGADEYIATVSRLDDKGNYTGELEFYAYGSFKPQAVKRLADEHNIDLENSYAYSDSITDVPLLECVGNPVAVNPDRELARTANERKWPITHFSKEVTMWDRAPVKFFSERNIQIMVGVAVTALFVVIFSAKRRK